jgi:hypothetical protein
MTTHRRSTASLPRSRGGRAGRSGVQAPRPYRQARRKRAVTQQMRRVEVAISGLPGKLRSVGTLPGISLLSGSGWHMSKLVSILLLAGVIFAVSMVHTQDAWFVYAEDVSFVNLVHLRADDLYAQSDMDGMNIFWLQPQALRQRLLENEWIEDVRVKIGLPAVVTVEVQEMNPIAVWITSDGAYWVAANGAALPVAGDPARDLPQIIDSQLEARDPSRGEHLAIDPQILSSALTLMETLPETEGKVRYNRTVGLNFPLPKPEVWVYWGNGFHMEEKLTNLTATLEFVQASEEPAQIVDIRLIDRPYVR